MQHFIKLLKAGGRAGVVIKNTFLSNVDNASPYTWWDYRGGAFHRDIGYRIDLLLASRETHKSLKRYEVHKDTRHKSWCPEQPKTSDHAPVMIEL